MTHNWSYPTQKHFANAILYFLRNIIPKKWKFFRIQISDNFLIISDKNILVFESVMNILINLEFKSNK